MRIRSTQVLAGALVTALAAPSALAQSLELADGYGVVFDPGLEVVLDPAPTTPPVTPGVEWEIPIWWDEDLFDTCGEPTFEQCTSDETYTTDPHHGFWSSSCGEAERARWSQGTSKCAVYFDESFIDYRLGDEIEQERTVYVPPAARRNGSDAIRSSMTLTYDRRKHFFDGLTSHYAGLGQASKEIFFKVGAAAFKDFTGRDAFTANGLEVASCNEYVYEKYFDYSLFEDAVMSFPDDPRAVVDLAFQPGGIGYKGLHGQALSSRSGQTSFTLMPWENVYPKNVYFAFTQEMPWKREAYPIRADLMDVIRGAPQVHHDFAWHQQQRQVSQVYPDDLLHAMDERQVEFAKLLEQRRQLYGRWDEATRAVFEMIARCEIDTDGSLVDDLDIYVNPNPLHLVAVLDLYDPIRLGAVQQPALQLSEEVLGGGLGLMLPAQMIPAPAVLQPMMGFSSDLTAVHDFDLEMLQILGPLPELPPIDGCDTSAAVHQQHVLAEAVTRRLVNLDYLIEQELIEAEKLGCLDPSGDFTPCDWSPRLFVRELSAQVNARREQEHNECVLFTADELGPESLIRQAQSNQISEHENMAASTERVTQYFQDFRAFAKKIDFPVDPNTGKAIFGSRSSDRGHEGNDLFQIEYSYDVGWRMQNVDEISLRLCAAEVEAHADFKAEATILGETANIIDAYHHMNSVTAGQEKWVDYDLHLSFMGNSVRPYAVKGRTAPVQTGTTPLVYDYKPGRKAIHQSVFHASKTIMIGPIPVTLAAGAAGEVGIDMKLGLSIDRGCPDPTVMHPSGRLPGDQLAAAAKVTATPFASLNAYASAAVDIVIASAGVRADLTLLRLEVPLSVDLAIGIDQQQNLRARATARLDVVLRALDGRVSVFIDTLFGKLLDETLFSWEGPRIEKNVAKVSWDMDLFAARLGLRLRRY